MSGAGTVGTDAAATLSLEISTVEAVGNVATLRGEYEKLHLEMGKTPSTGGGGTAVSDEVNKLKTAMAGMSAENTKLRHQVENLHTSFQTFTADAIAGSASISVGLSTLTQKMRVGATETTAAYKNLTSSIAAGLKDLAGRGIDLGSLIKGEHLTTQKEAALGNIRALGSLITKLEEVKRIQATVGNDDVMAHKFGHNIIQMIGSIDSLKASLRSLEMVKANTATTVARAAAASTNNDPLAVSLQERLSRYKDLKAQVTAAEWILENKEIAANVKMMAVSDKAKSAAQAALAAKNKEIISAHEKSTNDYISALRKENERRQTLEASAIATSNAKSVNYLASTPRQQASQTVRAAIAIDKGYDTSKYAPEAIAAAQTAGSAKAAMGALAALSVAHTKAGSAAKDAASHQLHWNSLANEGHAAARGLSGSLGMLWMTYGQMAPLLAGAALGAGFKAATKEGAEFAYQLTFVKALGGESAASVAEIGTAALSLSKSSMYGPVELANGLRILSQAGLSAKDAMAALPSAMSLATVGEMNMEQAAVTLTGVMNAFGMSVSDMPHIGDVFAKAAAMSQTSVVGMTEAMKTASVVGEQYGASMEDTATAITLLAKVNITGTAAGTSFRNMLKDMYTPSKQAANAMKDLGLETKTAAGDLRPFADVVFDLKGKLEKFDKASQVNILQAMFGERGAKEAIAMLGKTREEWDKLQNTIANSDGFMNKVTSELEMTTKGRFKQALNTMQSNLVNAFDSSEGSVRGLADSLRSLADSPAFVAGINAIVGSMASLAKLLVDFGPILLGFGAGWVVFKTLGVAVAGITAVTGALAGLGTAMVVVSAESALAGGGLAGLRLGLAATGSAAGVAAGATGLAGLAPVLGLLTNPITWVVTGVGALYGGFKLLQGTTPDSVKALDSFNDVLDRQLERLKESNKELEKSIRLKLTGSDVDVDGAKREIAAADVKIAEAQNKLRTMKPTLTGVEEMRIANELTALQEGRARAQATIARAEVEQGRNNAMTLSSYILDAEKGIRALREEAGRAGVNINTAAATSILDALKGTSIDPEELRMRKAGLEALMVQYRQEMISEGGSQWSAEAAKESAQILKDKLASDLKLIDQSEKAEIAAIQRKYKNFGIAEVDAIVAERDVVAAALERKVHLNEQAALTTKDASDSAKYIEEARRLGEEMWNLTGSTNGRLETARLHHQQVMLDIDKEYAKETLSEVEKFATAFADKWERTYAALQASSKSLDKSLADDAKRAIEDLNKALAAGINRASIKDWLNQATLALSDLEHEVQQLEAGVARDGGWFAKVLGVNDIQALIDKKLPEIRASMEAARAALELNPNDAESTKRYDAARKSFDKYVNYVSPVWKDTVKNIDDTFHKGFAAMFSKGKTDWKAFGQDLAKSFKTTVMDAIYQMLARPFIMNIVASVAGSVGLSDMANAASQLGGGGGLLGSAGNLFSLGKNAYSIYENGISGTLGNSMSSFGNLIGSESLSAYGTGMTLTAEAAQQAASAYLASGNVEIANSILSGAGLTTVSPGFGAGAASMASEIALGPSFVGPSVALAGGELAGGASAVIAGTTAASSAVGVGVTTAGTSGALAAGATGVEAAMAGGAIGGTTAVAGGTTLAAASPLASIPVVGWIALAVIAAYTLFSKDRGGPKIEGDYFGKINADGTLRQQAEATGGDGIWYTGHSGDEVAKKAAEKLSVPITGFIKGLGGVAENIGLNIGFNRDPKGDAPDNVAAGVTNAKGQYVYRQTYNADRDKSPEAMELEAKRMMLASVLAAEGLNDAYKGIVNTIDIATADAAKVDEGFARIQAAKNFLNLADGLRKGRNAIEMAFPDLIKSVDVLPKAFKESTYEVVKAGTRVASTVYDAATAMSQNTEDAAGTVGDSWLNASTGLATQANQAMETLNDALVAPVIDAEAIREQIKKDLAPVFQDLFGNFDITTATVDETAAMNAKFGKVAQLRDLFDNLGFGIDNLSAKLVNGANDLDSFIKNTQAYYLAVTSAEQQVQDAKDKLTSTFTTFGLTLPETLAGYEALVNSIDKTTPAGGRMIEMLMEMFPAFQQVSDGAEKAKDALRSQANAATTFAQKQAKYTGATAGVVAGLQYENAKKQLEALALPNLKTLTDVLGLTADQFNALSPAAQNVVSAFLDAAQGVKDAGNNLSEAINSAVPMNSIGVGEITEIGIGTANAFASAMGEFIKTLSFQDGLSARLAAIMKALSFYQTALTQGQGNGYGGVTYQDHNYNPGELNAIIDQLATTYSVLAGDLAEFNQYSTLYGDGVAEQLVALNNWYDEQKLVVAQNSILLEALNTNYHQQWSEIIKTANSALSELLHSTLKTMQDTIDPAISRAQAQAKIAAALAMVKAGGPLPTADSLRDALGTVSKLSADGFKTRIEQQREYLRTMAMVSELATIVDSQVPIADQQLAAAKDAVAILNRIAVGVEGMKVPPDAPVAQRNSEGLITVPSSVVTLPVNRAEGQDSGLLTELRALRAEINAFREEQKQLGVGQSSTNLKVARIIDKWDALGVEI